MTFSQWFIAGLGFSLGAFFGVAFLVLVGCAAHVALNPPKTP